MPIPTKPFCIYAVVAWLLVGSLGFAKADEQVPVDGRAVGGLRLRLELPAPEKGETGEESPRVCEVNLENVGRGDLNIQLGMSLANGRSHHPTALRLLARGMGDEPRTFVYAISGVAGRVDPLIVPMLAGSSYTLRIPLEKFIDAEAGERLDRTAKDYQLVAELVGEAVTDTNSDFHGLALMPYWQGTVRSNEVRLTPVDRGADK